MEITFQFSSITQLCPTLCDPMDCSMPGLPVHYQLPKLAQTHFHPVSEPSDHLISGCPLLLLPQSLPASGSFPLSQLSFVICLSVLHLYRCKSPLDCKETKPVNLKGNQFWIFIGRTDVEAETPVLRPPDTKTLLIGKDPGAGKDWRQQEKEATEEEMVGWHHRLDENEFV